MTKPKAIKLDQILGRRTKGYAFSGGTYEERVAYRDGVKREIENDYQTLSEEEFRKKYEPYIY